jgi:hypothetical protein
MSDRTIGAGLVIIGILCLLVDVLAVPLGLSAGGQIGLKRELLAAAGVIILAVGLWFTFLKKKKS